jgi:hypothetical protein
MEGSTEETAGPVTPQDGAGGPAKEPPQAPEPARSPDRRPAWRRLQIYSFDPMLAQTLDRAGPATVAVAIPYEPLKPGPSGDRVQVVDFDGANQEGERGAPCFYRPVDLDGEDRLLNLQDGLAPTEADPRFHQQMTYAVAMRVFEAFDRGLGRRLRPRRGRLRMFPHAFRGANAFYDSKLGAVLFGYFNAAQERVGANLPGQMVYTCLSHDIIAHETTHAVVDRLRSGFMDGTNEDLASFHEAFADIVAIFLHFTLPGLLGETIAWTRTRLNNPTPFVQLAEQFGHATGAQGALRTAIDRPDPTLYTKTHEPHERGSILVAAVFEAFFTIYQRRIADLLRLATGGRGVLPAGALHPDLVNRVAREATRTASQVLDMCIHAFDFLPVVDATYGDFLRALVTADRELDREGADGLRTAFVDAFRRRGIYPTGVLSLAEDALVWERRDLADELPMVADWFWANTQALDPRTEQDPDPFYDVAAQPDAPAREVTPANDRQGWARALIGFAHDNADKLDLNPSIPIRVAGFHPTYLSDAAGAPHINFVVQFAQSPPLDDETLRLMRRGTNVIADARGKVRYVVSKPMSGPGLNERASALAKDREARFAQFLWDSQARDYRSAYTVRRKGSNPLQLNFAQLHGGRLA